MTILSRLKQQQISIISLVLMLETLHVALWHDFGGPISRSIILVHFGLFLIWQPIWRGDETLSWLNGLLFIILTILFITWMNLWLLFGWIILLIGFLGGVIKQSRGEHSIYMITLAVLIFELIMGCTPQLFDIRLNPVIYQFFNYGLVILPLSIFVLPIRIEPAEHESVDLLRAITSSLLIGLVALGSLVNMFYNESEYLYALIQTILAISVFLIVISWLLSPRFGFSGLSQLWSRSLLNIGTPFEQWLTRLSNISQHTSQPERFLDAAMEELVSLPWIDGVHWSCDDNQGQFGQQKPNKFDISVNELSVTMFTHLPTGGALLLHCNLLIKLVESMYSAKMQERQLAQQTHLQTIYETGARITHDIKNLLQSLKTLTTVIERDADFGNQSKSQQLLKAQLPHLTQRLQLALDKLQTPVNTEREYMSIDTWSKLLRNRLHQDDISFTLNVNLDHLIPSDLFDSVIDNLLENIANKKQTQPGIKTHIKVTSDDRHISIAVCDTGTQIPQQYLERLFKHALDSEDGLGIGLYQAAKQAELNGYQLNLQNNRDGEVCFVMEKYLLA